MPVEQTQPPRQGWGGQVGDSQGRAQEVGLELELISLSKESDLEWKILRTLAVVGGEEVALSHPSFPAMWKYK
jgi:hypothetical protein